MARQNKLSYRNQRLFLPESKREEHILNQQRTMGDSQYDFFAKKVQQTFGIRQPRQRQNRKFQKVAPKDGV